MDDDKLRELDAATVAHSERLKAKGVTLPVPAAQLLAHDLMRLSALDDGVVRAIVTNLRAFTALRALATIRQSRAKSRAEARAAVSATTSQKRLDAERRARQVELLTDSSHFDRLEPSLKELGARLRTVRKKLGAFTLDLRARHREFVRQGLAAISGATIDAALTGWMSARCAALERELDFFVAELQGPLAMRGTGHAGPPDNKSWHRVSGDAVLRLKEEGVKAAERRALLPGWRPEARDPDAKRRQRERESKAARRAKKRRKPNG